MQETVLTEELFNRISSMVYDLCGINLHEGKKMLVQARLAKRIRILGLNGYGEYIDYMESDQSGQELSEMIDALTTNKTEFMREVAHLDYMEETVLPEYKGHTLRIWSAGCSSGEEPYSLGIKVREAYGTTPPGEVRILATDISRTILDKARKAYYSEDQMRGLSLPIRNSYFDTVPGQLGWYTANRQLTGLVSFARLNLTDEWPMRGPFDVIFCRNVMIYFDKKTQEKLVNRFYDILSPNGYLFVGHSESLAGVEHRFNYIAPAIYRR